MKTIDQACWEHIRKMRELDKKSILEGDPECTQDGVLGEYESTTMEWQTNIGTIQTRVLYFHIDRHEARVLEQMDIHLVYRAYWSLLEGNKEHLGKNMTVSDVDARIRQERIDAILND